MQVLVWELSLHCATWGCGPALRHTAIVPCALARNGALFLKIEGRHWKGLLFPLLSTHSSNNGLREGRALCEVMVLEQSLPSLMALELVSHSCVYIPSTVRLRLPQLASELHLFDEDCNGLMRWLKSIKDAAPDWFTGTSCLSFSFYSIVWQHSPVCMCLHLMDADLQRCSSYNRNYL